MPVFIIGDGVIKAFPGAKKRTTAINWKMEMLAMLMMNLVKEEEDVDSMRQEEITNFVKFLCED